MLLEMYKQMFNDINRHILVIWQSVGVLIGAFALFSLVRGQIIPIDLAISLVLLISIWLIGHLYDASYWYNRNLVIIANIERQFLKKADLREIHYYFGKHRETASMLTHLSIQWWFGLGVAILVLLYHFSTRLLPKLPCFWTCGLERMLPYLVLVAGVILLFFLRKDRNESYESFLRNSPGKVVDTEGIEYGTGHPAQESEDQS